MKQAEGNANEGTRFFINKGNREAGLWNEMHHILAQLLAAEILNRVPVY